MESDLLEKAETVIQVQSASIEELTKTVFNLEENLQQVESKSSTEIKNLIDENGRLRLHLDALNAEAAAAGELSLQNEKTVQDLMKSLAIAEEKLLEKENLLNDQKKLLNLPLEKKKLSEENVLLKRRIEELERSVEDYKNSSLSLDYMGNFLRPQEFHKGKLLGRLGYSIEESHITRKCLVQVESDLSETEKLAEEQKKEIQWLYQVIDSLNKEKALLPPILSLQHGVHMAADFGGKTMDQLLQEHKIQPDLYKGPGDPYEQFYRERSSAASAQQKIIEEQRNLLGRVLKSLEAMINRQIKLADTEMRQWKMETGAFYKGRVLHSVVDPQEKTPPGFINRIMSVKLSNLCLFDDPSDETPLIHLRAHKVNKSVVEPDYSEIKLYYSPGVGSKEELHTFRFSDADEYQRWYHALRYAGFLRDSRAEKVDLFVDSSKMLTVDIFTPNGKRPDGTPIPTELKESIIAYNSDENALVFESKMLSTPLKIPCEECTYKAKPEYNELIIQHHNTKMRVQNKNKEAFSLALSIFQQGKWKEKLASPIHPVVAEPVLTTPRISESVPSAIPGDSPSRSSLAIVAKEAGPQKEAEEGLFVIKDGNLLIYESGDSKEPSLKLSNTNSAVSTNAKDQEITIISNPNTPAEEVYVFLLSNDQVFNYWCDELEKNGFKKKPEDSKRKPNQVGVVTKDLLELYRYYGSPGAKPMISLDANVCTATASSERREIRITKKNKSGKAERITLDCSNKAEFDRWKVALTFGGFIKEGAEGYAKASFGNLSKYVFPVKLFDQKHERSSGLVIENQEVKLFATPEATAPLRVIKQDDCEVQTFIEQRKIRIYINRNTPQEERLDLIVALAKEFDRLKKMIEDNQIKEAVEPRRVSRSQNPFVLCKKGSIAIYKDKYQQSPDFLIERDKYNVQTDDSMLMITFTPTDSSHGDKFFARTLVCSDKGSYNRWDFTLKVAGFKIFSEEEPPKYFFPYINYGHVCSEALDLNKTYKRRSSGIDIFRLSSMLKAKNQPPENILTESNTSHDNSPLNP